MEIVAGKVKKEEKKKEESRQHDSETCVITIIKLNMVVKIS